MSRLNFASKTGKWRISAEKCIPCGNEFAPFGNMARLIEQVAPSSTERHLQIQYRYPSPLKRSVRPDRPLFSVLLPCSVDRTQFRQNARAAARSRYSQGQLFGQTFALSLGT